MNDISGQPNPPNPFIQGSTPSVTPKVDLRQTSSAFDALLSHLEESINKQFNIREKSIKNLTTGEENYWKMATRYADTFSGMLSRQHDVKLSNLKKEQAAKEQAARNEIKNEEELQKRIAQIRGEYLMKEAQSKQQHGRHLAVLEGSETVFGGLQRAAGIAVPSAGTALSEFGSLLSSAASGTVFFATAIIAAAKATVAYQERQAELARSASGLVSAGFAIGTTGMGVEALRTKLFSGVFEKLLSPTEQRAGMGVMGQSPALLGEAAVNTEKFHKALFMFGNIMPNSTELLEMFSKNSKDLGLNLDEIANVFTVSRLAAMKMSHSQREFNINQKDTIDMYLSLQKSFRAFTTDGHMAAATLLGLSSYLKDVAKGPREKREFVEAIGGGVAGLKATDLIQLYAFSHGGALPTKFGDISHPAMLLGTMLKGITSQFGKGTPESFAVEAQLQEKYFPNLPPRLLPKFDDLIGALTTPGITDKEQRAKMAQFEAEAAKAEDAGRQALVDSTTGLTEVENKLLSLWSGVLNDPNKVRMVTNAAINTVSPIVGTAMVVTESIKGARHK